jgi:hypothetical protein
MALHVELICGDYRLLIPANPYPMYPYAEQLNHITLDSATVLPAKMATAALSRIPAMVKPTNGLRSAIKFGWPRI